jgi:hypothetical protein
MKCLLMVPCSPHDSLHIKARKEINDVERLSKSIAKCQYTIKAATSPTLHDIASICNDFQPAFVHFSFHGDGSNGVLLENAEEESKQISTVQLMQAIFTKDKCELIVFNGCMTFEQAKYFSPRCDFSIGTDATIPDDTACKFSELFYTSLFRGLSIESSFLYTIQLLSNSGHDTAGLYSLYHDGKIIKKNTADFSHDFGSDSKIAKDMNEERSQLIMKLKKQQFFLYTLAITIVAFLCFTYFSYKIKKSEQPPLHVPIFQTKEWNEWAFSVILAMQLSKDKLISESVFVVAGSPIEDELLYVKFKDLKFVDKIDVLRNPCVLASLSIESKSKGNANHNLLDENQISVAYAADLYIAVHTNIRSDGEHIVSLKLTLDNTVLTIFDKKRILKSLIDQLNIFCLNNYNIINGRKVTMDPYAE